MRHIVTILRMLSVSSIGTLFHTKVDTALVAMKLEGSLSQSALVIVVVLSKIR